MPITVDARRSFVRNTTALSIWFARRLAARGTLFRRALANYTNIYRFTSLWDGQNHPANPAIGWQDDAWENLLDQLDNIHARYPSGDAPPEMETESLDVHWPFMEERLKIDVAAWPTPADKPFGFFHYRPGDSGWNEDRITLHLNNPFAPVSPFADSRQRAQELANLLNHAKSVKPTLHTVSCASWLVSFAPFQALFPPSFAASASGPRPLAYHYGWWGQMMDRAGDFNHRNAGHLRNTGEFPYPCIYCAAPINETAAYLRERFGVGAA
jgi:hypothetical protein